VHNGGILRGMEYLELSMGSGGSNGELYALARCLDLASFGSGAQKDLEHVLEA
jgi:hypothetical protein